MDESFRSDGLPFTELNACTSNSLTSRSRPRVQDLELIFEKIKMEHLNVSVQPKVDPESRSTPPSTAHIPIVAAAKGSRWADDDDDDDFLPLPTKHLPANPVVTAHKPVHPTRVKHISNEKSPQHTSPKRQVPTHPPVDVRLARQRPSGQARKNVSPDTQPSNTASQRAPVVILPATNIKEIADMKKNMASLAEERKKLKLEEEARLEAEKRRRCDERLKALDAKKKASSTPVVQTTQPTVSPEASSTPLKLRASSESNWREAQRNTSERTEKRKAFNEARKAHGFKLSKEAPEFVPSPPLPSSDWNYYYSPSEDNRKSRP